MNFNTEEIPIVPIVVGALGTPVFRLRGREAAAQAAADLQCVRPRRKRDRRDVGDHGRKRTAQAVHALKA